MAQSKKLRMKKEAMPAVIQSYDDVVAGIKRMGDLLRQRTELQDGMNNHIAELQKNTADRVKPIDEEVAVLEAGIAAYCTVHREKLTNGNKVKFADLITGKVYWRNNPHKVVVRGVEAVIALMENNADFSRFIRYKKEINKEAVLNEAALFDNSAVPGLSIVQGKEQFVIEPYNQNLPNTQNLPA